MAERPAPNPIRFLAALLAAAGIGWLAYTVRGVLAPLATGILLAYALNPIVNFLERKRWKRIWATVALFAAIVVVVSTAVLLVVPPAVRSSVKFVKDTIPKLKEKLPQVHEKIEKIVGEKQMETFSVDAEKLLEEHAKDLTALAGRAAKTLLVNLASGLDGMLTVVSWVILVPIYTFFALVGMDPLWRRVKEAIPAPLRPRALKTLGKIHRANAAFFRGQTTICGIKAVLGCVLYALTGLPFSLLVGLFHGVASFFPFVGTTITFVVVAVLGFVDVGWSSALIWPMAALVSLEMLESFVLQPTILGKETGLHPVLVILAFLVCGQLFGFFGLLLAVPLFTAGKILFEDYVIPLYTEVGDHVSSQL